MNHLQDPVKDIELKPCPFCGSGVLIYIEDDDWRSLILNIRCVSCPASMVEFLANGSRDTINKDNLQRTVDLWNNAKR